MATSAVVDSSWRTRVSHYLRPYFPIYKVELFEQIRREYEFGVGTIKGLAGKLKVHRRMVRQALASAEPPARKPVKRARPTMGRLSASSTPSWKPTAWRRASGATPRIASGSAS